MKKYEFEDSLINREEHKEMYFAQYYDEVTLSWKEIRESCSSEEEAIEIAYKRKPGGKLRIVHYLNGARDYKELENHE